MLTAPGKIIHFGIVSNGVVSCPALCRNIRLAFLDFKYRKADKGLISTKCVKQY
jgi:hypothetical protein